VCLASGDPRPRVTLGEIVRLCGDAVARTHRLATVQQVALRAIAACRTAVLGGHRDTCDRCGASRVTYNSCRNRHCPACQSTARDRWLEARRAEVLPIPYFHVVFTLPHALNALAQGNPRVLYGLLFRAATETLLAFGRDPRHLGGTIGVTAILHTWGQTLAQHLHLHCVVTGGALSRDGTRWIPARRRFLFPVRALALVFRARYLEGLQRAHDAHRLTFAGGTAPLAEPATWRRFLHPLHAQPWVVYAKPPFGGPARVLAYLARYTHRVAITNARLLDLVDGVVRFRWKDYADQDRQKSMTLSADEFLRRFLLHVLPTHFVRIRHAGLFGNHGRHARLDRCRALLGVSPVATPAAEAGPDATAPDPARCPVCRQGTMHVTVVLAPVVDGTRWPRAPDPP
jgi:hypothetical protein